MKPNILLDYIGCHFVTHRLEKIAVFQKLSAPQLLPDLRKLLPNLLGADRLQQPTPTPIEYFGGKLRNRWT
jgi:hypothetical protein